MYLHDDNLTKYIKNSVKDYREENIGAFSYDVSIAYIIKTGKEKKNLEQYELLPGETVFVASNEVFNFPDDCLGMVGLRYSCIRQGLSCESPVYYPGHNTRLFTRISNMSDDIILLSKNDSVVSIMYYKLDSNSSAPYHGRFQDQFEFSDVSSFESTKLPELKKIEKKVKDLEGMEKGIYATIITVMTIFTGLFSLINLNINILQNDITASYLLLYNFMTLTAISFMASMIYMVIGDNKKKSKNSLWGITIGLLVLTLLLYATK